MYANASSSDSEEDEIEVPLFALYVLVSIIGVVGNVSLLAALSGAGAARLRSLPLLSACAADLLVCAASAPLAAARALIARPMPCQPTYYVEAVPVAASTLSLLALAAERSRAVRRGRGRPCLRARTTVALVWAAAATLGGVSWAGACWSCGALEVLHAVLTWWVPALGVARCHWAVRARLTALSLRARAEHGELPLPVPLRAHVLIVSGRRAAVDAGQPSLLGPQPQTSTLRARRRLGNVLLALAALFAACWGAHAAICVGGALGLRTSRRLRGAALLVGYAHSALNAAACWALNHRALSTACAAWRLPLRRDERASSTNEAALGAFHPRLTRPAPRPKPPPSSLFF